MKYLTKMLAPSRQQQRTGEEAEKENIEHNTVIALLIIEAGLVLFVLVEIACLLVGCV